MFFYVTWHGSETEMRWGDVTFVHTEWDTKEGFFQRHQRLKIAVINFLFYVDN